MSSKKLHPVTVTVSTLLVLAVVPILVRGIQLNNIAERGIVLALFGLLVISYILRLVLIFLGVIAIYQVIRERVNAPLRSNDLQVKSIT